MSLDVYSIVTEKMIALLEAGTVPWQKPWASKDALPSNFVSKKAYRGINPFLLACAPYACPFWVSYKQAASLGGSVKKGEKGFPVVFWNWMPKKDNGQIIMENGKPKLIPFLRYYTVFNLEQCEGISWEQPAKVNEGFAPLEEAANLVAKMPNPPTIRHLGNRACYAPVIDVVTMPAPESFINAPEYYSVLFHELTHSTGHKTRLARKGVEEVAAFGTETYGKEELIAEMGAAFLSAHAGIFHHTAQTSASYLAGWIAKLKEDSKLVVMAAAQAQKAADYILNIKHEPAASE